MPNDRRVAVLTPAWTYVGPDLARVLAARGHDLVLGDPADGLVDELTAAGAAVEAVTVGDLAEPGAATRLADAALARFGRIDAACCFSGRIILGRFMEATLEQLHESVRGNIEAPFHFLKAVLGPMVAAGSGQVLVITSAAGARPTPGASLYSSTRAGAAMLVRNAAQELAGTGVTINAAGTNFMDFPGFRQANGFDTDEQRRARILAQVPLGRLGGMDEFAHFCAVLLDGTSRFQTGQFFSYSGGWSD